MTSQRPIDPTDWKSRIIVRSWKDRVGATPTHLLMDLRDHLTGPDPDRGREMYQCQPRGHLQRLWEGATQQVRDAWNAVYDAEHG